MALVRFALVSFRWVQMFLRQVQSNVNSMPTEVPYFKHDSTLQAFQSHCLSSINLIPQQESDRLLPHRKLLTKKAI